MIKALKFRVLTLVMVLMMLLGTASAFVASASSYTTVYFAKNGNWNNAYIYGFYGSEGGTATAEWPSTYPGEEMTFVEVDENGNSIYSCEVPADIDFIKFSDGSSSNRRTNNVPNSMIAENVCFTIGSSVGTNKWDVALYEYTPAKVSEYTVVFKNFDGTIIDTQIVESGEAAVAPIVPTREATPQYSYTFKEWDTDFSKITADTVVTAVYTQTVNKYTVAFKDFDGAELSVQTVEYGASAGAPEDPSRGGYKFTGWDKEFTNITEDTVVTAKYSKIIVPATTGKLRIDVAGGTGFKISVNGGNLRPQGTTYMNTKLSIGAQVTLVANTTDSGDFLGWLNESGAIVSLTDTYTFNASGNDYFKAVYKTAIDGVNVVLFNNDKAAGGRGQIIDMQYYAAGDEILFPEDPTRPGYVFVGWNMTAQDIEAKLSVGEDAVVIPTWEVAKVYIDVVVNGGTISTQAQENGKYLAYNALTVAADEAPAGMKFAYWTDLEGNVLSYDTQYKSYPSKSVELTAVYVAENVAIEKKPLVFLSADPTTAGEKITYTLSWDVDASIGTVTAYGLMVVDVNDYNADTFYHGSGDAKIFDRAVSTKLQKQEGTSITLGDRLYDHTYCVVSFVIYTDAVTGESITVYSDMAEVYKPAP